MAKVTVTESSLENIAAAIRAKLGVATEYKPGEMAAAIQSIPTGGSAVLEHLSVTQNGTYTPGAGVDGYDQVTVNVSGGGGVPLLTSTQWDALTTQEKQAYGLVAIQTTNSGYIRGNLVNGADYIPFDVYYTGTAKNNASVSVDLAGSAKLIVIAMNSEASTKQLETSATLDGNALSGTDVAFNSYQSSGTNRRNYRITSFDITSGVHDLAISLVTNNRYSSFVYIVLETVCTTINKELSTPDAATTGTNDSDGVVLYGTFAGESGGTIQAAIYTAGDTITTQNPGTNYKSSYIFWFV